MLNNVGKQDFTFSKKKYINYACACIFCMSTSISTRVHTFPKVHIAPLLWQLLISHALLPDKSKILLLLCALFFMHVYPSEKVACSRVGGSNGAIDTKTL